MEGKLIRIPPLDLAKVPQYSSLFDRGGAQNGLLNGSMAISVFERSALPNGVLGKIWALSNLKNGGALNRTEFIAAMYLLTCMKTHSITAVPNSLPQGLLEAAARRD
jgi:epidermal growth factor receptor substrate 15